MPQRGLSRCCSLGISDCLVGLFECQVCCQALARRENTLSPMCWVFIILFFFFCLPHRNIVKGVRSLREILRTVETKATQTFKMVRGGEMGRWSSPLCRNSVSVLTSAGGQKKKINQVRTNTFLFLKHLEVKCQVMHLIQRSAQLKPLSLRTWACGLLRGFF